MRSRASIKAHPIHPMLIPFPFAFLAGAALFDVAGVLFGRAEWWITASHLTVAGVATGLLAAVPGVIDYLYSVPPESSGKTRAAKHGAGNVVVLLAFAAAWWLRSADGSPTTMTLLLEVIGGALLIYTGLLGGTLVIRNMVSVDHRYADKGKWNESSLTAKGGEPLIVADADELQEDQMKLVVVNGHRIVLARTPEGYTAFDDRCTHRGGSLAGGVAIGGTVQCLWHGSQFDCTSGKVVCGPAGKPIRVYKVDEHRGKIRLVAPPG